VFLCVCLCLCVSLCVSVSVIEITVGSEYEKHDDSAVTKHSIAGIRMAPTCQRSERIKKSLRTENDNAKNTNDTRTTELITAAMFA